MITFSSLGGQSVFATAGKASLLVFAEDVKGPLPKADLTFYSQPQEQPVEGTVSWPGEYDYGGISIKAIGQLEGKQVSYVIDLDGARCAFLSSPLQEWTDKELEHLGNVGILCLPAEQPKRFQTLVDAIDPPLLILTPGKGDKESDEVLKLAGTASSAAVDEYKQKGALPTEGREVVLLKPKK